MKASALILFVLLSSYSQAQRMKMDIHMQNGSIQAIDVDSIGKIDFIDDSLIPHQSSMKVFSGDSIMVHYGSSDIDSIKIGIDAGDEHILSIYRGSSEAPTNELPVHTIDSISFFLVNNPKVIRYPYTFGLVRQGNFRKAVWLGDRIYCSTPVRYFDIDSTLRQIKDSTLYDERGPLFMRLHPTGKKLLAVRSFYPDVSVGWLTELGTDSLFIHVLDSGKYNSSACYVPGTDDIIYYTYGSYSDTNSLPSDAGYYYYDRATGTQTFLLHHISDLGPGEMVHGFDISPNGKKLLIPSVGSNRSPFIVEYDLVSKEADTLEVQFKDSYSRWALWLRYNSEGTKLLYSQYPLGSFSESGVADTSEIGIVDLASLAVQVLPVNPETEGDWINVFPEWSQHGLQIVYSSAGVASEPQGVVSKYQVCILKNF